jgi:hypothetical protein
MDVKGHSAADRITRWELLINNLRPEVPQMPHLADEFKALEEILPDARILATQQEDLRSQARDIGDRLKKMLRDGDHLRTRMGSVLKGKLGFSAAALAKYGFNPAPLVRRRKVKPPASEEPGPTPVVGTAPSGTGTGK